MFIIVTIPIIPLFCVVWPKHMTAIFSLQVVWFVIVPVGENLYNGTNDRSQTKLCLNRNTWTPIHLTERFISSRTRTQNLVRYIYIFGILRSISGMSECKSHTEGRERMKCTPSPEKCGLQKKNKT